ncbi:MAG: SDR family NAD(P)-dependent oxidoreductase [Pseudomonadota bacterium]
MSILITGANRGIGAEMLSQYRAANRAVQGTARTPKNDLLQLDVSDAASVSALSRTLDGQTIDLLVCNAGVYLDKGQNLANGYEPDLWAQTFAVNVTGVFLTVQALLPQLQTSAQPKIAIISSQMASHERAPGGSYIYRASKAAALNLGRNLASDLHDLGIAVGIYHPGWVQTDMGGASASTTPQASAAGLIDRFDALTLETTGCFETFEGHPHPY